MIGQTISHYTILEKLGEGGMGVVYKAHDTTLDRFVALKFLPAYLTSDATEKERFYHEARAASSINHPNATTIHEIAEYDGRIYIAMEYVEGKTLKQLLGGEVLPVKKVLDIVIQCAEGLAAAHEKGVVHRDIKSDNIMMAAKGQVKIMDFGLAKVKGATKLTKAGSTIGTAAYMSPEQARGEEVDQRSDIFSFGVVLYELLTGRLPFRGEHQAALMYSLMNEEPQPIARFNEAVSPDLERIVLKALMKDRDDRYQHADDLLADLRRERKGIEYARAGYARTTTMEIPAAPARASKRPMKLLIVAASVIAAAVLAVLFNPFNLQVTQQQSAAAPAKRSLAVMYFQNIVDPGDKNHTGDMLADLLITSLSQSGNIEVISRERLYDLQKELQADSKSITPDMASKVARRAGVTTMLLGSVVQEEPALMVTTRLIDVETGKILGSQRVTGYAASQIFQLVDTLALLVRAEFGAPAAAADARSIAEVTTKSPEAYRSFLEGWEAIQKFYFAEAVAAYRKAIELDSTFAMAYYALSAVENGQPFDERRSELAKANALSAKLPDRERLLIQSAYVEVVEQDGAKAATILEQYVARFPREKHAYIRLGIIYGTLGDVARGIHVYDQGLAVDSTDKSLWNLRGYSHAYLGNRQEAYASMERYVRLAPAEPNPYDSRGDITFMLGDADSALIWWNKALGFRSSFNSSVKIALAMLNRSNFPEFESKFLQFAAAQGAERPFWEAHMPVLEDLHKGKLAAARERVRSTLRTGRSELPTDVLVELYGELVSISDALGDAEAELKYAQEAVDLRAKDRTDLLGGRARLALAYEHAGRRLLADQTIARLDAEKEKWPRIEKFTVEYAKGVLLAARGDHAGAVRQYDLSFATCPPVHAPQFPLGVSLIRSGNAERGAQELARYAVYWPIRNFPFDLDILPYSSDWPVNGVRAHYWLGVAYEQLGKKDQAVEEYRKFLEIWKEADFPSKEIEDAKARSAKLKGMAVR